MPEERRARSDVGPRSERVMPVDDPVAAALKRLHDEVTAEPLPEDFLRLLGEIERKLDDPQSGE